MTAATDDESKSLAAMLRLGRAYAVANSDAELVQTFAREMSTLAGVRPDVVVFRLPATLELRAWNADGEHVTSPTWELVRPASTAAPDRRGWAAPDTAGPTRSDALGGVAEDALVAVAHFPLGSLDVRARARLTPFVEQLAGALLTLAERSETARLRLYAGSIVDRTNVPIGILDREGGVRLTNAALRNIFEQSSAELAASGLMVHVVQADRAHARDAHLRAVSGLSSSNVELSIETKQAPHRMLVDFEPIFGNRGEVDSVLVVGHDITRVRQLEDQISHADRLAVVGQLAAGVVHELNNPLTSILVYTEFVLRRVESRGDDADAEKLRRVVSAAERIQEFARSLITYARSERGDREPLSIAQVLDQAIAFCEPVFERQGISISRKFDESLPQLAAVRGQLQQVFINLLTNAAHAVGPIGGRIHVVATSRGPNTLEVAIEDNGPGVPQSQRDDVFRPFVTTKPAGQGTGLGLPIVRSLIERHGGTVAVGDAELGGARFVVMLPVQPPSERPPRPVAE